MADCCYVAPTNSLNLADANICGMVLGGIIALPNGTIYRRIATTIPCNSSDYVIESFSGGGSGTFNFVITDGTNSQNINDGETITFLGQNGMKVTVSNPDTVTFDGLTTYSTGAPSGSPTVTNQINFHYDTTNNTLYGWNPSTLTWQLLISSASGSGSPLPVADFTATQRALTASLNAQSSTSTQQGITISYAWTCSPSSGVTFSSTTSVNPTVTFPSPGLYTITLTVTDSLAHTATYTKTLTVNRELHVKGARIDTNGFNTLAAALAWIDTNDSANASLYTIKIHSPTDDTGSSITITNNARLQFEAGATINQTLVLPTGTGLNYYWSGVSQAWKAIDNTGSSNAIQINGSNNLYLSNIRLNTNGSSAACILINGDSILLDLKDVFFAGSGVGIDSTGNTGAVANTFIFNDVKAETEYEAIKITKLANITFSRLTLFTNRISATLQNCTGVIDSCYMATAGTTYSTLVLTNCNLKLTNSLIRIDNVLAIANNIACIYVSGSSTVLYINKVFAEGWNATGIIVINDITQSAIEMHGNMFRGSIASLGFYSTPVSAGSWTNCKSFNNVFEGTVTGITSYYTSTDPGNNNTVFT